MLQPRPAPILPGSAHSHASADAEAASALRGLVADGKRLRRSDIKRCRDYAVEVLRDARFTPWLLVYTAASGEFKEGWIPDNFYGAKVKRAIQGPIGWASSLKSLAGRFFAGTEAFPNLGSRINDALFDSAYRQLTFAGARARFFETADRILFKSDVAGRGTGIHFFDPNSFEAGAIEGLGNGVFQRYVTQHPLLARFAPQAVATIRLTTVVEPDDSISARAAYLRLGTGADTHVRSTSQVRVPADLASGELAPEGFLANWRQCSAHPTSGEPFAGRAIPAFAQCLSTVLSLHERVRYIGCVGWDLTVEPDETVRVLEWNGFHNDIKFSEATQGPCFRGLGWEELA